jgi:hypothetical protein
MRLFPLQLFFMIRLYWFNNHFVVQPLSTCFPFSVESDRRPLALILALFYLQILRSKHHKKNVNQAVPISACRKQRNKSRSLGFSI